LPDPSRPPSGLRATSLGHAGLLIESRFGSIVCDPWFLPAFFGSWFVFPRNDRLDPDLVARVERADFLYVSHLHADHLDAAFLAEHLDRDVTVLVPGFPGDELERALRGLGFRRFLRTRNGEEVDLGGMRVAIHVETAISDGPQGDSALVVGVDDVWLVDQNDCRPHDPAALCGHGPVAQHWLQFSGAIWYPMVYDIPEADKRSLAKAKVDAQFSRAMSYVRAVGAGVVAPSAGPPAFLDPELFGANWITGEEISIFPDQTEFLRRLEHAGLHTGRLVVPGTAITSTPTGSTVEQPVDEATVRRPFDDKAAYLAEYQADWAPWMQAHRASWPAPHLDLVGRLAAWWEPLLATAPSLRAGVGGACLLRCGDTDVLVDFPAGTVRAHQGEPYRFRFDIDRGLVESVVAVRAVDWSNSLFLSCRFRAWREGAYNEFLYHFFKSLSPQRMARAEAEARIKIGLPATAVEEEIALDGWLVERYCPHRRADLSRFGEVAGGVLTCTLHGWRFDLATGRCLTAQDHRLRVRPAS